jgi:hypothetical protein
MDVSTKNFLIMLSTDQIKQIENYCLQSGVPYYEVQTELVDHMAEWIEFRLQTSSASFEASFLAMQVEFSPTFLKQIQTEKKNLIQRGYWCLLRESWLTFFTWPKLLVLICLYLLVWLFGFYIPEKYLMQAGFIIVQFYGIVYMLSNKNIIVQNIDNARRKLLSIEVHNTVSGVMFTLIYAPYILVWWDESIVGPLLTSIKWVYPLYVLLWVSFFHTQVNFHKKLRERYRQAFS